MSDTDSLFMLVVFVIGCILLFILSSLVLLDVI